MGRDSVVIVTYDPGVSTGLVVAEVTGDDEPVIIRGFEQFIEEDYRDTATRIINTIDREFHRGIHVVFEQFDLRPHNKFVADLTPVKINSIVEYEGLTLASEMFPQIPAQAKRLVSNEVLKNLGWYPTGRDVNYKDANDVRDAFRHLVYHLVITMKHTWTAKTGWPQ